MRQGDKIWRNQALEDDFKKVRWDERGTNICGQCLTNLKYVDDIALITDEKRELLNTIAKNIGLNMIYSNAKTITNT